MSICGIPRSASSMERIADILREEEMRESSMNKDETLKMKKKRQRCDNCNKKTGLHQYKCDCSNRLFCSKCRYKDVHSCSSSKNEDKLREKLVKLDDTRVTRI